LVGGASNVALNSHLQRTEVWKPKNFSPKAEAPARSHKRNHHGERSPAGARASRQCGAALKYRALARADISQQRRADHFPIHALLDYMLAT